MAKGPTRAETRGRQFGKGKGVKKHPPKKPGMSGDKRSGKPSPLQRKK